MCIYLHLYLFIDVFVQSKRLEPFNQLCLGSRSVRLNESGPLLSFLSRAQCILLSELLEAVDLHCHSNNRAHHTDEVDTERLVLRRGQPFTLTVQCRTRPLQHLTEQLALVLHTGKDNGTGIKVSGSEARSDKWRLSVQPAQSELLVTVCSPASAPIGLYRMDVVLYSQEGQLLQQIPTGQFCLLFNPWCKDDPVFLPDEEMLQEYILNETGLLYQGSWEDIHAVPWNFGQFEKDIVDVCFEILDNSLSALKNPVADFLQRRDPVYVSRVVTAMINANDDKGVLLGRWSGDYSDGTSPTRWTGSVPVLRQWSRSGGERVRYGQCWVFTGVACTVLRCLGIPTRCITNYSSAHDTDGNLQVDRYYSETLESLPGKRDDMIWNYHCWVESWMARKDLPAGFDGWQVLDPTPQERSDGIYCCGPCPVKAIKEGNIDLKYDAPFIFAEVNADLVCWIVDKEGSCSQAALQCHHVGRCISTKSVHGDKREDVTQHYKYPEGSAMEREVYAKAGLKNSVLNSTEKSLQIGIKHVQAVNGSDFDIYVEVSNKSFEDKDIGLTIVAKTVTYNGIQLQECHRKTSTFSVKASNAKKEVLRLKYEHYGKHLSEHHLIRITALLEQKGRGEVILHECNISLSTPQLAIKIIGEPVVSRKLTAQITFVNPLPITLSEGVFTIEGAGLTNMQEIQSPKEIKPGQEVTVSVSFKPTKPGLRKLLVDFDTNKLRDVKGCASVIVRDKNM
ncbi:protein-glutamine gamma-glutamyltransferase 2 isoform X1 [Polyodon spathula]|uniref:protein-glutamine gamma-glutamyltransferase 2 isoform X1 n=1 Tax=Polyodon spathula TaxID=7913 RepID=UPI001B7E70BE|nr:protein-glutamine gamma-glutamyltransferase 2 isoform X1 [Polyodon spathula]